MNPNRETHAALWDHIDRVAKEVDSWPYWKRGGSAAEAEDRAREREAAAAAPAVQTATPAEVPGAPQQLLGDTMHEVLYQVFQPPLQPLTVPAPQSDLPDPVAPRVKQVPHSTHHGETVPRIRFQAHRDEF